jgi:hypothetical protein
VKTHRRPVLLVALGALLSAALFAAATARSTPSAVGLASATNPCQGLSGAFATGCRRAEAECQALPASEASVKAACTTELARGFAALAAALAACAALPASEASAKAACDAAESRALTSLEKSTAATAGSGSGTTSTTSTTPPAPPVQGVSADATPVTGTVLVNGAALTKGASIPIGATVDTTAGTVTIESVSPTGVVQHAQFHGGVFKLEQPSSGVTELVMKGGNFGVCSTKGTRRTQAASPKTTVVRVLWGNGHGSFTTEGRYAAATVRGTVWQTQDRCDGTRVYVQTGAVSVLDRTLNKTVTVTAGHSYLAKS